MSLEDEIAAYLASGPGSSGGPDAGSQEEEPFDAQTDSAITVDAADAAPSESVEEIVAELRAKWGKCIRGRVAVNLLMSSYENDFSGMIQSSSPSRAEELAGDLCRMLKAQGSTRSGTK